MKKWVKVLFIIIVLLIIVVLGIGLYFYKPYLQSEPNAVLNVDNGKVEVDSGNGFVEVKNGTQLKEGWIVRTGNESEAEIIFLGSASIKLDELSSLIIKKINKENRIVSIEQGEGDIWYDILEGSGIKIELETPDGNFTNEGTSFGCSVSIIQPRFVTSAPRIIRPIGTVIPVLKGSVIQKTTNTLNRINSGTQGIIVTTNPIKIGQIVKNKWIENNENRYNIFLVKRRNELKNKYSNNIALAKKISPKLTDELINKYIDQVLKAEINVNDKIKDGTIPKSAVRFIPTELLTAPAYSSTISDPTDPLTTQPCPKKYRVNCEVKMTCVLKEYIEPQNKANKEIFDAFKVYIANTQKKDKDFSDNGKWVDDVTYSFTFQIDRGGWGVGCSCYDALSKCQKNTEELNQIAQRAAGTTYPLAYSYTSRQCTANSRKQISCEEIS